MYRNTEAHSRSQCCRGKAVNVTYCECVSVAFLIQNAQLMRCTILTCLFCLALFFHIIPYRAWFYLKKKNNEPKVCVLNLSTTFVWIFSHSKKNSARYHHSFRKILKYQISRKSVQWEPSCPMRTDRQTEGRTDIRDKTNRSFSQFCTSAFKSTLRLCSAFICFLLFWEQTALFPSRQCLLCGKGWTFKYNTW